MPNLSNNEPDLEMLERALDQTGKDLLALDLATQSAFQTELSEQRQLILAIRHRINALVRMRSTSDSGQSLTQLATALCINETASAQYAISSDSSLRLYRLGIACIQVSRYLILDIQQRCNI